MAPNTIPPPPRQGAPAPDPKKDYGERYVPTGDAQREVDTSRLSAFPPERRFTTIYPFTRASEAATDAAFRAAREHDRSASSRLLDVLSGRTDEDLDDTMD